MAIVLGVLFASCVVCGGIANMLDDEGDTERTAALDPAAGVGAAEPEPTPSGPLTPEECEAAMDNLNRLMPGTLEKEPAELCRKAANWGAEQATQWRCIARAEQLVEIQLCGGDWGTTVANYMASKAADNGEDSDDVAGDLGIGPKARGHLKVIAGAYRVTERIVGDKAAKASELCLGGMDQVAANPKIAVRKVEGALEFGAGMVSGPDAIDESVMSLDDLFVSYVVMKCPDPSRG